MGRQTYVNADSWGTISGITRTATNVSIASKAEVGDLFYFADHAWYVVDNVSGVNLQMRQITNFKMEGGTYTSFDSDTFNQYYFPIGVLDEAGKHVLRAGQCWIVHENNKRECGHCAGGRHRDSGRHDAGWAHTHVKAAVDGNLSGVPG